jgi:hypothetical protein
MNRSIARLPCKNVECSVIIISSFAQASSASEKSVTIPADFQRLVWTSAILVALVAFRRWIQHFSLAELQFVLLLARNPRIVERADSVHFFFKNDVVSFL